MIIQTFYEAFARQDAEAMAACYHDEVVFSDPAFGTLKGERAKNMWRMLVASQKGKDFVVTFSDIEEGDTRGSAKWEAQYNFSKTGRRVHNKISAQFRLQDGKIIEHHDTFNLHRWSRQALGAPGLLLGWSGFFRKKLHAQTNSLLDEFEQNR
ncbi:MAG: nuclear transport factor 2 family protein [Bacteroidota bacterium]